MSDSRSNFCFVCGSSHALSRRTFPSSAACTINIAESDFRHAQSCANSSMNSELDDVTSWMDRAPTPPGDPFVPQLLSRRINTF